MRSRRVGLATRDTILAVPRHPGADELVMATFFNLEQPKPPLSSGEELLGSRGKLIGTPHAGTHTLGNWESDNAIDVGVPQGTPIYAPEPGVIGPQFGRLTSGGGRFGGLRAHLRARGNEYYFAHLSRFGPGIAPGSQIKKGQLIGYTGVASGVPHLHLGVRQGDPRSFY